MARHPSHLVLRRLLCALAFVGAFALVRGVAAADGYYNGLKLPYPAGQARVVIRSTSHGAGRHAVDFSMYYEDVLAMYGGRVIVAAYEARTLGKYIMVDHGDNFCSLYLHLDKWYVKAGQAIQQGERIALSGNTGASSGAHLHVAVFRKTGGACHGAGAGSEVMMLFDERPKRELQAGDWLVSQNGKPFLPYYPSLSNVSSHNITVNWNDYSNNEKGFKIEQSVGKSAWSEVATVGGNAISYTAQGLSASTSYCFRVRAYNEVGNSGYSNIVCATTKPADPNEPSATTSITLAHANDADEEPEAPTDADAARALYHALLSVRLWWQSLLPVADDDAE